jgi:small membrane protein
VIARVLLLAAVAGIGWYACVRRHRLPVHLVLVLLLVGCAAALLVAPELGTRIANMLGVGRGADLVGYVVDVLLAFVALHYYAKFIDLETKVTTLTRAIALSSEERR